MTSGKRVVIVGGGVGGLFLANALIAQGIEPVLYEQAAAFSEVGAGVYLTPNSVRHLIRVGLGPAVEEVGALVGEDSRYYRFDGTEIAPVQVEDPSGWNATYGMHRADLVELLYRGLPSEVLHTGHRATGFEQNGDVARVSFANGEAAEADIVVGADGIHSILRPIVHPESKPVFSGTAVYRGLVPRELLDGWRPDVWQMWLGPGKHFLSFPVRRGELINFVGFVPARGIMRESWTAPGDPDELRQEFEGWDPRIAYLLSHVESTFRWSLYDRDPIPVWTKGRLTLLGDAAHPMLPHLGQGANQSIEDGMALSLLLGASDPLDAPAALQTYESLRRTRVAQVQIGARRNGLRYDSMEGDLERRDAEIRSHAEFRRELYGFDVVQQVTEALQAPR
jgi:salicylate hydroxylase